MKKTNEKFTKEVYGLVGDGYTFLETYVNTKTKLEVVHNTCGHRYEVRPAHFISGKRCPACNVGSAWTNEMFLEKVRDAVGDEYTFLESYVNTKTKLEVVHNTCGNSYSVTPSSFLRRGNRCHSCKEPSSAGERKIADYLNKKGIRFEREKTFSDLKVINSLRYDFAVYHKGELVTLIEYDGELHFVAAELYGGEDYLLKTQLHDQIKNEYARQNNIPLLRIPYNKYGSINKILDKHLSEQIPK